MTPRLVTYRAGGHGVARMSWVIAQGCDRVTVVTLGTRERRTLSACELETLVDYREPKVVSPRDLQQRAHNVH